VAQAWEALAPGESRPRADLEAAVRGSGITVASLGARLGLEPAELDAFAARRTRGTFGLGLEAGGGGASAVLVAGAHTLPSELVRLAVRPLAAGQPLILVAHADLPMAADLARERLAGVGLAGRQLAVLHGLTPAGWRELGAHEGELDVLGELDPSVRFELEGSARAEVGLGRLLMQLEGPRESRFDLASFARAEGLTEASIEDLAVRLVERAFGRASSLAGRAEGTPLCGLIPERKYARFVDATLEALEAHTARDVPLAGAGGSGLLRRYRNAWKAGLDEGAVLLFGGEAHDTPAGGVLAPSLMVNLLPSSHAFRVGEPLAQLRLARDPNRL
jgi:hypothetical protein